MISQSTKDRMHAAMPEVLRHYGISPDTRNFKALWRDDANPSCCYYPETNLVHDFGEGSTMDVFALVGRMENAGTFPEQARIVSEITGIGIGETEAGACRRERTRRPRFDIPAVGGFAHFDALEAAKEAFSHLYEKDGAPALRWIYSRGFDDSDVSRYGLGFVKRPRDFAGCFTYYDPKEPYGYVVIPYPTRQGFDGVHYAKLRAIPGKDAPTVKEVCPKSITPPLFHEYMLMQPLSVVYVAEGLLDAMAMEKLTGKPCVGLGGSELSKRIGRILSIVPPANRPRKIVIAADSDEAGRRAADTIAADLRALHMPFSLLEMPEGCKDPDDVLMKYGK